jgi:hypothetical protein
MALPVRDPSIASGLPKSFAMPDGILDITVTVRPNSGGDRLVALTKASISMTARPKSASRTDWLVVIAVFAAIMLAFAGCAAAPGAGAFGQNFPGQTVPPMSAADLAAMPDGDDDGIPDDFDEYPDDADQDDDGVTDGSDGDWDEDNVPNWEDADALAQDVDGDGIPDLFDVSPLDDDANGNGVPDGVESDADGDGILDSLDTYPTNPDANDNGTSDGMETDHDSDGLVDANDNYPEQDDANDNGLLDGSDPMYDNDADYGGPIDGELT